MGADYIPEQDGKAAAWFKFFARALVENPSLYRTTPEDAAAIDQLVHDYRVAHVRCWPIGVRTRSRVTAKNQARKAAERVIRPTAQRIRCDLQIPSSDKVRIGLRPRKKRVHRVAPPQSTPILNLHMQQSGQVVVKVRDSASNRAARPREAIGLELYERVRPLAVVGAAHANEEQGDAIGDEIAIHWRFVGVFTNTPITIYPGTTEGGAEVTYAARWITRRGEPGAVSRTVYTRFPFGAPPRIGGSMPRAVAA